MHRKSITTCISQFLVNDYLVEGCHRIRPVKSRSGWCYRVFCTRTNNVVQGWKKSPDGEVTREKAEMIVRNDSSGWINRRI